MIRAVDTNVIVRTLVADDPRQTVIAKEILRDHFTVAISVFLEVEWVLRSQYRWSRGQIADNLREIIDLATLRDTPNGLAWAVDKYAAGADFADVVHLISSGAATSFATFDRRLAAKAGADAPMPIETLI